MYNEPRDELQTFLETTRRNFTLTVVILGPLLLSFIADSQIYPITYAKLFHGDSNLSVKSSEKVYYILQGKTVKGDLLDIPAIEITDALYARNWSMVYSVMKNQSFSVRSPHPDNIELAAKAGGVDKLLPGARLPELLRSWGTSYNARLPVESQRRLRSICLNAYKWPGGQYGNYRVFVDSSCEDL